MADLWARIELRSDEPVIARTGLSIRSILDRLDAAETPDRLCESSSLDAGDLIAALGHSALASGDRNRPALVQQPSSHRGLGHALEEDAWKSLLPAAPRAARLALAAGLLQIHDFWEASHEAAQQADDLGESQFSPYWHGIAHRREPDAGNAAYWFRRVGRHPLFTSLAAEAGPLLAAYDDAKLTERLAPGGTWNPFAFIDLCTQSRHAGPARDPALELQRLEMKALLRATARLVLGSE